MQPSIQRYRICLLVACCLAVAGARVHAQGAYSGGAFELGDGMAPAGFAGKADIRGSADQAGVDWGDLFTADAAGAGGAQGAVFIADDVSLGVGFEGTALAGTADLVRNGTASAADDIGNAYSLWTRNAAGETVLYLGLERLSGADGFVEFEISRSHVRLGHGGFGVGRPWTLDGERRDGDALVRVEFAAGGIGGAAVYRWLDGSWQQTAGLAGEGCDEGESVCALTNAGAIEGGAWAPAEIPAGRFVEVGVNLGPLPAAQTLRVRTGEDIAFGYFAEGN